MPGENKQTNKQRVLKSNRCWSKTQREIFSKCWESRTEDGEWSLFRDFYFVFFLLHLYNTRCLDIRSERIDFMVSYVMLKTIQRLENLKRGHATTCLQWEILDLLYKFIKEDTEGPGFLFDMSPFCSCSSFGIPCWRFLPPSSWYRTEN